MASKVAKFLCPQWRTRSTSHFWRGGLSCSLLVCFLLVADIGAQQVPNEKTDQVTHTSADEKANGSQPNAARQNGGYFTNSNASNHRGPNRRTKYSNPSSGRNRGSAPPSPQSNQHFPSPPPMPQYQGAPVPPPYLGVPPPYAPPPHYQGPPPIPPQYQGVPPPPPPPLPPYYQGAPPRSGFPPKYPGLPPPPPLPPNYQRMPPPPRFSPYQGAPPPPPVQGAQQHPPYPPQHGPPYLHPPSQQADSPSPNVIQYDKNAEPSGEEGMKEELKKSKDVLNALHAFLSAQKKIEWMENAYYEITRLPAENWSHLSRIQKWEMLFNAFDRLQNGKKSAYTGIPLLRNYLFNALGLQTPFEMGHAINNVYEDACHAIHRFLSHQQVDLDSLASTAPIAQMLQGI